MSSFEYVMVIVAIIMGFGITTLLKGAVGAMRSESTLTPGLIHSLWVAAILIQHVVLWSVRWNGERREDWPAIVLFFYLLLPILYYTQAELLFPRGEREVKLNEYFIENRRPFFTLAILGYLGAAFGPFLFYEGVGPALGGSAVVPLVIYGVVSIVSLALLSSKSVRLHTTWAVVYLAFNLAQLGILGVG
jgi:hypothetical protein